MEFFSSNFGVAIAWICTVLSFLFGLLKNNEVKKLKLEITSTNSLKESQNTIENVAEELDQSKTNLKQIGEKNIYANKVSGGMNIKM